MAVGLSLQPEAVPAFRKEFNRALANAYPDGFPDKSLVIDLPVKASSLSTGLLQDLDRLAPFGQGNPEPVFSVKTSGLTGSTSMGSRHFRSRLPIGNGSSPIELIGWNLWENRPPENQPLELAFRFGWNVWRGIRTERLTLLDWKRLPEG